MGGGRVLCFYSIIHNVVWVSVTCVTCRAASHQMWRASVFTDATEMSKHYGLAVIWVPALEYPTFIECILWPLPYHPPILTHEANIDPHTPMLHAFHCYTKTSLWWIHAGLWVTNILTKLKLHKQLCVHSNSSWKDQQHRLKTRYRVFSIMGVSMVHGP